MNLKRTAIFMSLAGLLLSSCASLRPRPQELVILATPIDVEPLTIGRQVDALEDPEQSADLKTVVSFKIERVLKGDLPKIKRGGPSKWEQAQEHFQDKSFLKIVTADFEDPDALVDQKILSVAVQDPLVTFGIKTGQEDFGPHKYRLQLKTIPGKSESYVLVESRLK